MANINHLGLIALLFLFGTSFVAAEENCTPSKWGRDDQLGAANLVNPDRTLLAAALVKKGESHPLGIVIDPEMPAIPPRKLALQVVQPSQQYGRPTEELFGWPAIFNDDLAQLWWGIGPQLDGLGHMGEGDEFYNCNKAADISEMTGLTRLGIHQIPQWLVVAC